MKRNIFLILFLLVFVSCSLLLEGTKKTFIRSGKNSFGDIIANLDDKYIREGEFSFGDIIANIDGNYIREGKLSFGDIIANIDGNYIREGKLSFGDIIANIDGNYIREGKLSFGDILFNIDGPATIAQKAALAAAALRLAGRLQLEREKGKKNKDSQS
jgi:C-terminal processing protease CtpA/Prc